MPEDKEANRYFLAVEVNGIKMHYDFDERKMVAIQDSINPKRTALRKIDELTSEFSNVSEFIEYTRLNIQNAKICIGYKTRGSYHYIAPVFNDKYWQTVARDASYGSRVDLENCEVKRMIFSIFDELSNPDSEFTSYLLDEKSNRSKNLSEKLKTLINEIKGFALSNRYRTSDNDAYLSDLSALQQEFCKRMSYYREFRTLCAYYQRYVDPEKFKKITHRTKKEKEMLKKRFIPVSGKQISMFDNFLDNQQ